jgi:hypothetical protein
MDTTNGQCPYQSGIAHGETCTCCGFGYITERANEQDIVAAIECTGKCRCGRCVQTEMSAYLKPVVIAPVSWQRIVDTGLVPRTAIPGTYFLTQRQDIDNAAAPVEYHLARVAEHGWDGPITHGRAGMTSDRRQRIFAMGKVSIGLDGWVTHLD